MEQETLGFAEHRLEIGAFGVHPELDHAARRVKAAGDVAAARPFPRIADVDDYHIGRAQHGDGVRRFDFLDPYRYGDRQQLNQHADAMLQQARHQ